ncbi:MAG: hypothetical protein PGN11_10785 [Quadrisphaera sp.]
MMELHTCFGRIHVEPRTNDADVNCGVLYVSTAVVASGAVALTICGLLLGPYPKVKATSSAVSGWPSLHCRSGLSLMVSTVPSSLNENDWPSMPVGASLESWL